MLLGLGVVDRCERGGQSPVGASLVHERRGNSGGRPLHGLGDGGRGLRVEGTERSCPTLELAARKLGGMRGDGGGERSHDAAACSRLGAAAAVRPGGLAPVRVKPANMSAIPTSSPR